MKLCIIGNSGHWGYARQDMPNHTVVGIAPAFVGEDMSTALETLKKYGVKTKIYDDYRELLPLADIAIVNTRFDLNAQVAAECLAQNIYVFSEKPLATTLEQLEMLRKAQEKSKAFVIGMFGIRYSGWYQTLLAEAETIGKIRMINGQKSYKLGVRPDFYKRRDQFGGLIPWVAIHAIDWVCTLAKSEVVYMNALVNDQDNFGNGDLEMTVLCQFRMANGILASVNADYYRPLAAPTHDDDRVRVVGTEGILEYAKGVVTRIDKEGTQEIPIAPGQNIFSLFLRWIAGEDVGVTSEESFYLTEIALKARELADQMK